MKAVVFVTIMLWLTPSIKVDSDLRSTEEPKTYFVIDQKSRSEEGVFTSFQEAFDYLSTHGVDTGVTLEVAPNSGPYLESVDVYPIRGNTRSNPIVLKGNNQKIQAPTRGSKPYAIKLNGDIYIEVEDLIIK